MSFTEKANKIFQQAIRDYHLKDDVDADMISPYERNCIEYQLYLKCWIDTVQWHLEDIIRDPHINPSTEFFFFDSLSWNWLWFWLWLRSFFDLS